MSARAPVRLTPVLVVALLATAWPRIAAGQVFLAETQQYHLSGGALLSYNGSAERVGDRLFQTHRLAEGLQLQLSGWIYDSRYVRFRAFLLALRSDSLGGSRAGGYALGYGGALSLFSRSILPVSLVYGHGLGVAGATLQPVSVTSSTSYLGIAQLVSPALPRAEVRAQRLVSDDAVSGRATTDTVGGAVYGTSALHRYSAVASWSADQYPAQPRVTRTLASISDEVQATDDTRGSFQASMSRSSGLGGQDDFTAYQASGSVLSRLSRSTLLRAQYGYATLTGQGEEETSNQVDAGTTIDLHPVPLLLGEGVAASTTRLDAAGLHRTIQAASASQGVATSGRWRGLTTALAATGQAGYATVSDGQSGAVLGYGLNGNLQLALPGAPVRASAYYTDREDLSSAGISQRAYGGLAASDVSRFRPLFLVPQLTFAHVDRNVPLALGGSTGAGLPQTVPAGWTDTSTLSATLTGMSPLRTTQLSFSAGYVDSWSSTVATHTAQVFGRVGDAFRVAARTFGNVSLDANHRLGGSTSLSAIGSLVWSFRESSLSLSYAFTDTLPRGAPTHNVAFLFSRSFDAAFLPEGP